MESTAACLSPRSGVTAPIADPSVGLKRRNVRDRMLIRFYLLWIKFLRVLFFKIKQKIFARINALRNM
jgi:hypothetical protein